MMVWIRVVASIIVFFTSCVGLGDLAGFRVRRRKRSGWVSGLMSVAIALLWPAIVVSDAMYEVRHYKLPTQRASNNLVYVAAAVFKVSRTLRARALGVNGFSMKAVPSSSTP